MCLKNVNFSGGEAETVAYAAHCQQEAELDRPIAGHTNICPQALNSTKIEVKYSYTVPCKKTRHFGSFPYKMVILKWG